ncbi:MAG: response regulator transcription factor [Candidatus Sericytochromatia bacterium]|nr:response regulator transcription factor [Candidatus Tanganyikabacteria bacterium]
MVKHVLVVEEDPRERRLLEFFLTRAEFEVEVVAEAGAAIMAMRARPAAAAIVSFGEQACGIELCRALLDARSGGPEVPVIVIGGPEASPEERCRCFECGVWDFMPRPVDHEELVWRLRAHLQGAMAASPARDVVQAGGMQLDTRNHTVSLGGDPVMLTPNECAILHKLLEAPGRAFDVETLLVDALGYPPRLGNPEIVRTHVRNLRQKLEDDPREPKLIVNLPRIGYAVRIQDTAV